ncbi:hypothetical protein [Roseivirga pacifica]|uniref:hypothetical protein n=1 Tax=Roseivirga pacifica TaxID=1267423 RepID=UPI003BA8DB26
MNNKRNWAGSYSGPSRRNRALCSRKPLSRVKNRQSSILSFSRLVKTAREESALAYEAVRNFNSMPLGNRQKRNSKAKGYVKPRQIENYTLESLQANQNLIWLKDESILSLFYWRY